MKKITVFFAIFMAIIFCMPSFTSVFAETYSFLTSAVQEEKQTKDVSYNIQTYPYILEEGMYRITYQNHILTSAGAEQDNKTQFILSDTQTSDAQLFYFTKLEHNQYKITLQSKQKVLTVKNNGIVLSNWTDDPTQHWSLESTEDGMILLKSYNGQTVGISSENSTVILSDVIPAESFEFEYAAHDDHQNFDEESTHTNEENINVLQEQLVLDSTRQNDVIADGYYEIRSAVSGKNLEVYGVSHAGGAKITQWYATGGRNQKWKVENQGDGTVRLTNVESGLVLDYNASINQYEQWDWHGRANQRWQISSAQNGNYFIQNASNGHAVDLLYGNMGNGQHVVDFEFNGGENQQWQFIPTDPAATQVAPDGYYEIKSAVSGKNLEIYGASLFGGGKLTQWDATGGSNQKWKLENQSDGTVRLTNVGSGLVLDYNASMNEYEQWDWHGRANQRWQISKSNEGNYYIRNASNEHAMDLLDGNMNNGQYVVDSEFNGGENQQWQLVPTKVEDVISDGYYEIKSAVSGKNLEIYGLSHEDGAVITQWYATGGKNQKWKVENQGDGTVRLTNVESGLVLDYNANRNQYEQWSWQGTASQKWQISRAQGGNYYIQNASNEHAMDLLYGNMGNGQHVVDFEFNGGENQQWQFIPTDPAATQVAPDGYYEIKSAVSGKNLEIYGASLFGGGKLTQWDSTGGNNQKWKLENQSDGTVCLMNVGSGLVLDYNASINQYEQWDWHGKSNQRWQISKSNEGNYYIRNASNEHAMDLLYGNMDNGQHVVDMAYNGGINQQWQLAPTTVQGIISDGYYEIRSVVSGKNLEVYGASHEDGAVITQWYATGGKNQKWKVENQGGGTVRLTNVESGLALDYNASADQYEQWNWNGATSQRWQISRALGGNYYIQNVSNAYAMEVLGGSMNNGQYVVNVEFNEGINQQWQFIPTDPNATQVLPDGYYEIKSAVSGKNLEIYGASLFGGGKLTQWDATGGRNQKWRLENQSDGTVSLTNVSSGLVLDYNASINQYEQWDWHGGANQRWQISKSNEGNYYIRNASNEHAMDLLYGNMDNGQHVVDMAYNGGINQQWKLVPTESISLHGIDVSVWQGDIDWQKVKASGKAEFAIIRAGYGRELWQKDEKFEQNYAGAKAQNIPVGIYQFSYADGVEDALREADACLTWLNGRHVDLNVIYDIEHDASIQYLSKQQVSEMAIAWCQRIEAAGYKPMIYTSPNYLKNKFDSKMLRDAGYDMWIANYGRSITYDWPYPAKIWQYTSLGSVDGIEGSVDMNIMYTGQEYNGNFPLPSGPKGMCTGNNVNVRTGPFTSDSVLFQTHMGHDFTIIKEQDGWYQVSFGADRIGWIFGSYVRYI